MTATIHFKYWMHGTAFRNNTLTGIRGVYSDNSSISYDSSNVMNLLPYTEYHLNDLPNFSTAGFKYLHDIKFLYYQDLGNNEKTWKTYRVQTFVSNVSFDDAHNNYNNTKTLSADQSTNDGYGFWVETVGTGNNRDYSFETNSDVYILLIIDSYPNSNNWYYPNTICFANYDLYENASVTDNHKPDNIYRWFKQKTADGTPQYSIMYPQGASGLTLNLKSDKQLYIHDLAKKTYTKISNSYPLTDIDTTTYDTNKVITDETPTPPTEQKTADISINTDNFEVVGNLPQKLTVGQQYTLNVVANKTYGINLDSSNLVHNDKTINFQPTTLKTLNRKDGSRGLGFSYTFTVEEGSYKFTLATKDIEYLIVYKTNHLYLTTENPNTGLDQKLTNFRADTDYTVKYHKEENWSYSNIQLTNGGKSYLVNNYDGTFTLNVNSADVENGSMFQFTATETDNTPKPTQYSKINLLSENVTVSPEQVELNKTTTITITADSNHVLTPKDGLNENIADAYYQYGSNGDLKYNFYLSSDHKSATANVNPATTDPINVSCVTKISNQPETDRKKIPIKLNLTNCKADITELPENTEEEWNAGNLIEKTVTLTADNGYIFDKDIIYYSYSPNDGVYIKDTEKANNSNTITIQMLAGDSLNYIKDNINNEPSIIAVAHPLNEPVSSGLDSINIYHMRNAELDNLSNKIITYVKQQGETSELESYDYTRFIGQVYRLPFAIPNDIEENVNKVSVGLYNLNMVTKKVTKEFYDINIGSIVVPADDSTSYNALKVTLYLPFINSVDLSINDVVGNTLKITYRINLLNGVNTLIIENNNGILVNQNVNVSTSLQIFGNYYDKDVNHLNSVLNNNLRQAYLVISKKEPIRNLLTYPTNEHGTIKDYSGLTKFVNTQLHVDATFQEKQSILTELEQGVFIK